MAEMDETRKRVWLGILGGGLFAMGAGLLLLWALQLAWSKHMFLFGLHLPAAVLSLLSPFVLLAMGGVLVVSALRRERV
jgi:hypothetical protein